MDYISWKWPAGSRKTSTCHQRMWFILGLMRVDTSLHIHTDVCWKWRTLIIRAEWLRTLITCSLYTACFLSEWSWTDFPADGDRVARWRDPPHMRNHTFHYVMLAGNSPCEIHPCVSSPWLPSMQEIKVEKSSTFLISTAHCACFCCHACSCALLAKWTKF